MTTTSELSIVLPCYNPDRLWIQNITTRLQSLLKEISDLELIIVNDGSYLNYSQEDIQKITDQFSFVKVLSYPLNQGKGHALREGVKIAKGNLIIYTDIDFPYTHESLMEIFSALKQGNDLAVGVRGKEYYTHLPSQRIFISKTLRFLIRKFLRIPTDDTQCGLKGFNQKGKDIFLQTTINRYLFDLEFIFLAARKKLIIKTVEVNLREGVELSSMRWKILFQESGNFLKVFAEALFS
ncbi:MAG: hypothetical protein JWO06_2554 [Bacteroidota bacterium]|nr:hypothetical protein [Bacteroidota bacterium]